MVKKLMGFTLSFCLLICCTIPSFAFDDTDVNALSVSAPGEFNLGFYHNESNIFPSGMAKFGSQLILPISKLTLSYNYLEPKPSVSPGITSPVIYSNSFQFGLYQYTPTSYSSGTFYCSLDVGTSEIPIKFACVRVDYSNPVYYFFGDVSYMPIGFVYAGPLINSGNTFSFSYPFKVDSDGRISFYGVYFIYDSFNVSDLSFNMVGSVNIDFNDSSNASILKILLSGNFEQLLPALQDIFKSIGDHIGQAVDSILDAIKSAFGSGSSGSGNSLAQNIQDIRDTVADETDKSINQGNEELKQSLLDNFTPGGSNTTNENGTSAAVDSTDFDDIKDLSIDLQDFFSIDSDISDGMKELTSDDYSSGFLSQAVLDDLNRVASPASIHDDDDDDDGYIDYYQMSVDRYSKFFKRGDG